MRRCIELSATKYCPVSAMLAMGETEIHHGYRVENTGANPFTADGEVVVTGPHWVPIPAPERAAERRRHPNGTVPLPGCMTMQPCV